ncbi:MAG: GNAT family N-acetyltransferase [Chloroflexota bacterium]
MQIEIRRVRPFDGEALAEFYSRLSPESRRARFLGCGAAGIAGQAARTFCTPDHIHEEGFVALAARPSSSALSEPEIVGHLCLVHSGTAVLELGVAVADDHQGRGIGRRLFEAALAWAHDQGCARIVATAFADNARVLRLLSSAPHPPVIEPADGGVVEVVIPLVGQLPTTRSWPPYSADHAPRAQAVGRRRRGPRRAGGPQPPPCRLAT